MANTSKTKDKVENPEAYFVKPKQVVKDNALSHDEKRTHSTPGSRTNDSY
jgi:hypothetical protein